MNTWSERFVSEYERFVNWFPSTEYKLLEKGGSQVSWKDVETTGYEEPSRNKLETFIKFTMKNYLLCKDGEEITDVKLLAKQFRECKKRKTSITKESKNVNKKQKKEQKEEKKQKKEQKEEKVKKLEKSEKFEVIVRNDAYNSYTSFGSSNRSLCSLVKEDFNTSDTFYIDTLPYWTKQLRRCFGIPTEYDNEDFKYEWKIMVGSKIFSIYNWLNGENKFDDLEECEWYLAGNSINTSEQKFLMEFINTNSQSIDENESESELGERQEENTSEISKEEIDDLRIDENESKSELGERQEENTSEISKEEIDDLRIDENEISLSRNVDDRDEMIDIELDLIDDDVEINIDDIDFDF
jgi:hypothetical protein